MWQIMTGRINNNNVEFEGFMLDSNLRDVIYNLQAIGARETGMAAY
jgi:hypothetical protein